MKKIMILAMMFMASSVTFAGNSDGLKAILKAKTYDEANQLLKQNLASLADNAEKAKAYNHLVDLAMKQVDKESTIILENQAAAQLGQKIKAYDTLSLCDGVVKSLEAAIECNKYDQMPNAKNKIDPKYAEKNAQRVWVNRFPHLVTYGDDLRQRGDKEGCLRLWKAFVTSSLDPFFKDQDKARDNEYCSQIAYLIGRTAAELDRVEEANKYYEIAMKDTAWNKEAGLFLITLNKSKIKTAADTAKYISYISELANMYPKNEQLYGTISDILIEQGKNEEVIRYADERLAKQPDLKVAHVYKGMIYMNDKKFDDAIKEYNFIEEDKNPIYLICVFNKAVCKYNKASDFYEANSDTKTGRISPENENKYIDLLKDAQKDFEKAKELDPNQESVKWSYLLRNVYTRTHQQEKADALQ